MLDTGFLAICLCRSGFFQDLLDFYQLILALWSLEGHFHIGWYLCVVTLVLVPEVPVVAIAVVVAAVALVIPVSTVIVIMFILLIIGVIILTFVIGVMDVLSLIDLNFLVVTTDVNVVDLIDIPGVDAL